MSHFQTIPYNISQKIVKFIEFINLYKLDYKHSENPIWNYAQIYLRHSDFSRYFEPCNNQSPQWRNCCHSKMLWLQCIWLAIFMILPECQPGAEHLLWPNWEDCWYGRSGGTSRFNLRGGLMFRRGLIPQGGWDPAAIYACHSVVFKSDKMISGQVIKFC